MSVSKEFMDTVATGNKLRTRIILSNYMVVDPSFREFEESLAYALKSMPNLIVPHDGEEFNYDMSAWTKDYFNKESNNLVDNFSQERIDFLKQMCAYLYKDKISSNKFTPKTDSAGQRSGDQSTRSTGEKHTMSKKQVGTVTAGAGAVVAVAGLAMSSTPVAIAGAVVAVAGGILILSDK